MRIHRVKLTNFRGVAQAEVTFPDQGVTIIEGDNEIGKTSLSEAIDLLLAERDDSNKQRVKAVKPVDKDVGAEAEIEMATGPYRFVYRKRWHKQKETILQMLEPQHLQLTGREAHDKVREILAETLDDALWEAFRLRQGTELQQAAFAGGSLGRALDLAAGGDAAGDREDDLWDRIVAERERYWTATGQVKVDRAAVATRVTETAVQVADVEAKLRSLDDDVAEVERLADEAKVLAETKKEHEGREAGLATQFETVQRHRTDVTRLEGLRATAQAQRDLARGASDTRSDLTQRAATTADAVRTVIGQVQGALPARQSAEALLTDLQQQCDAVKLQFSQAETAHRRAVEDRDYLREQIEVAQLSERLARVTDAIRQRAEAETIIDASHVDDALVARIEAAGIEVARAEASASTGAASVAVEATVDLELEINGETDALSAGDQRMLMVAGTTQVVVPGQIKVIVTAGAGAQALADRLAEARGTLQSLCAEGRVADLVEARLAAAARHDAGRVLDQTAQSLKDDLRDLSAEALAQKIDSLTTRIAGYQAGRPTDPPLPVGFDAAETLTREADSTLQDRRQEMERLGDDLTRAQGAVQELDVGDADTSARLNQAQIAADQEEQALAAARVVATDEAIAEDLAAAETALSACTTELTEAQVQLAVHDPETIDELLRNARAVRVRLADELHDNEVRTRDLRTKLSLLGEEGLANQLDIAKSKLAHLTLAHEQLEARAAAARLLYETFARRRAEAQHRYVAPFREGIETLGRLVFGSTLHVDLADDLSVARRTLDGVTLDFADLSTGAKEQLGMISRLACASIVADDGGAPVIFDDALGWSDPRRLEGMGAVISKAGRSCQIIVLTCTPGRYASVGEATVVQLPS